MVMTRRQLHQIRSVLELVDGYLSTQPQDLLLAWAGGMMTWAELRQHVQEAMKLIRPPKGPHPRPRPVRRRE